MTDIRLIASDLDGTLVRSDGTVSSRTAEALLAAEDAGLRVVFVTGRPPRWLRDVAEAVGRRGVVICANGALRYDLGAERLLPGGHFLTPAMSGEIVSRLRAALPGVVFAAEYGEEFAHEPAYRHHTSLGLGTTVLPLAELTARPAAKLLARDDHTDADMLLAAGIAAAGELATFTHSVTAGSGLLEISLRGVTKASGLTEFTDELGLTADEVIAFGDMPNDVPMLAWAGRSYAVANAHPAARAAAADVTASNDDDGVAIVVEKLLG